MLSTLKRTSPGIGGVPYWVYTTSSVLSNLHLFWPILLIQLSTMVHLRLRGSRLWSLRYQRRLRPLICLTSGLYLYTNNVSCHWATHCPQILAARLAYWPSIWPVCIQAYRIHYVCFNCYNITFLVFLSHLHMSDAFLSTTPKPLILSTI